MNRWSSSQSSSMSYTLRRRQNLVQLPTRLKLSSDPGPHADAMRTMLQTDTRVTSVSIALRLCGISSHIMASRRLASALRAACRGRACTREGKQAMSGWTRMMSSVAEPSPAPPADVGSAGGRIVWREDPFGKLKQAREAGRLQALEIPVMRAFIRPRSEEQNLPRDLLLSNGRTPAQVSTNATDTARVRARLQLHPSVAAGLLHTGVSRSHPPMCPCAHQAGAGDTCAQLFLHIDSRQLATERFKMGGVHYLYARVFQLEIYDVPASATNPEPQPEAKPLEVVHVLPRVISVDSVKNHIVDVRFCRLYDDTKLKVSCPQSYRRHQRVCAHRSTPRLLRRCMPSLANPHKLARADTGDTGGDGVCIGSGRLRAWADSLEISTTDGAPHTPRAGVHGPRGS